MTHPMTMTRLAQRRPLLRSTAVAVRTGAAAWAVAPSARAWPDRPLRDAGLGIEAP